MVEAKNDESFMYVNSKAGFGNIWIVKSVNRLIYNQRYRHGGRTSKKHTIYNKIYLMIPIDLLNVEVKL